MDFLLFFWPWTLSVIIFLVFLAWWGPRVLLRRRAARGLYQLKNWLPKESPVDSYYQLISAYELLAGMIRKHQNVLAPVNIDWLYLDALVMRQANHFIDYCRECIWRGCENPTEVINLLEGLEKRTGLRSLDIGKDHWPEWLKSNLECRILQRQEAIAVQLGRLRLSLESFNLKLSEQECDRLLAGVRSELEQGLEDLKLPFKIAGVAEKESASCSK